MLNVHKLCVQFAGEVLFDDLSFRLGPGDRVGLLFSYDQAGAEVAVDTLAASEGDTVQLDANKEITFVQPAHAQMAGAHVTTNPTVTTSLAAVPFALVADPSGFLTDHGNGEFSVASGEAMDVEIEVHLCARNDNTSLPTDARMVLQYADSPYSSWTFYTDYGSGAFQVGRLYCDAKPAALSGAYGTVTMRRRVTLPAARRIRVAGIVSNGGAASLVLPNTENQLYVRPIGPATSITN